MLELNQIHCGNSALLLKEIDTESIDLTVTSPPYDNLRTYKGYVFDFETIAKELYRVTKQGGVVVWVVNDATINGSETLTSFKQAIFFKEVCGFNVHDTMAYRSRKPPLTHNRYEPEFEYMFVLSKGVPKTFNPIKEETVYNGDTKVYNHGPETEAKRDPQKAIRRRNEKTVVAKLKIKGNVWEYATGMNGTTADAIAFQHPAIFPEKLARDHIYSWSNEGDLVLDPMCGSGTTCKQALLMKRNYIGIDIAQEYVDLSNRRINDYKSQLKMEFV